MKMIVLLAVLMMPFGVSAQNYPLWKCDIKAMYQLSDDGVLGETEFSIGVRQQNPTIFFDETTGLKVQNHGGSENGTAAISVDPYRVLERFYIRTWIKGGQKSFLYHRGKDTITGLCEKQ